MLTEGQKPRKPPSKDTKGTETKQTEDKMQLSHLSLLCLGLLVNLQVFRSHPVNTGLGGNDVDLLKTLLRRLEESLPAETRMDQLPMERDDVLDVDIAAKPDSDQEEFQARLDEAAIREFLSAKNLKSVRNNDSGRKSSNCFGGRMDRIGSMSSLGCNTASRFTSRTR
ncbi:natriuretic peptides B [Gadus macrocephalus]|uniref:natriuretic peptides B n=1 Tax=Gadus macrocephalus TaxID=80720 RepID=UPI0028CBBC01|nr:natriuretic peptides B [Gadus macrocephalus]